uniref:WW domain-containing protein n=2 Tax=Dunaliella tertiolecta TaxID=3047 RepID=A0A7S3VHH8_DUNTE|mmetsp:Transcript_6812/g.18305  ORF Transcript_6812/g.18305 Transcript_6812/m.18305 type:complete len:375 (-) Transcript_6812:116-1240(-)|eukprot:CAMPEP_0202382280 /NCGR_PEP_ID=MMETSP1127-20130417/42142_1 /ASSEMBLY_ACC=CAM_ASM_000462 /TAXON_ID=3047 /ORGANISM="Dunaliella tertiolecta, Strain CCMP1320" /LENGTH=374 /DNA_ID=CAMNT_0048981445 /DNA_START=207 /DNA_END=1331 /DNA_ORIENTATION=-
MPLPAPDVHALVQELQEKHGCPADQARALACMFHSVPECLPFIEKPSDRRNAFSPTWKEYFSKKYQRYYYHGEHGQNGWDYPQQLQLQDWMLDSEMYGLNIVAAATICRRMQELLYDSWAAPGPLWKGVALLARLMCNVVACSNGIDKYRCIKASNQKVKEDILSLPGASCVIVEAGFVQTGDGSGDFLFPSPGAAGEQEALKRASLVAAKLQQLVDKRGFTGMATEVDDTDAGLSGHGNTKRNKWTGKPGFMYQQDVYECSVCASPINDGSERLFTRKWDAPHGQFRYHCQQCEGDFNLCEACWDVFQATTGTVSNSRPMEINHDPTHTFQAIHPRTVRHNFHGQESASNPWGVSSNPISSRARERLRERTGL